MRIIPNPYLSLRCAIDMYYLLIKEEVAYQDLKAQHTEDLEWKLFMLKSQEHSINFKIFELKRFIRQNNLNDLFPNLIDANRDRIVCDYKSEEEVGKTQGQ